MVKQLPTGGPTFQITNLTTDPFALATLSISLLSWIIAFAGSIASNVSENFPKFTWWGLVYQLLMMLALFLFYGYDLIDQYKNFLTSGFAIAFIYTTNSATNLVYSSGSKKAAAAAGVILLSMVNLIYVFYYGSENTSPVNQWIDSFSLKGPRSSRNPFFGGNLSMNTRTHSIITNSGHNNANESSLISGQGYVSSTRLNGFENLSARDTPASVIPVHENDGTYLSATTQLSDDNTNTFGISIDDFPYTARALYSYESNPDDENEISFEKGEILKVNDIHSRWWQAKRANGDIGICPSNYVELIE